MLGECCGGSTLKPTSAGAWLGLFPPGSHRWPSAHLVGVPRVELEETRLPSGSLGGGLKISVTWGSFSIRWGTQSLSQALTFYYSGDAFLFSNPWIQKPKISNQKGTPPTGRRDSKQGHGVQMRKRLGAGSPHRCSEHRPPDMAALSRVTDPRHPGSHFLLSAAGKSQVGRSAEELTPQEPAPGALPVSHSHRAGLICLGGPGGQLAPQAGQDLLVGLGSPQ